MIHSIGRGSGILAIYNKAVRDRIPEIIRKSGYGCNIESLPDNRFLPKLEEKLSEELEEYLESRSIEELADILEVVYRIAEIKGISRNDLESVRLKKAKERGGFFKNLFLIDTFKA